MTYKLKVIRTEEDPSYKDAMSKWKDDQQYSYRNGRDPMPERDIVTNALEVELTEEQFEMVKKSVISTFK